MTDASAPIVVGVNGSSIALDAAIWAGSLAVRVSASLRIVHAMPYLGHNLTDTAAAVCAVSIAQQRDGAEMILRTVEDSVRQEFPALDVTTAAVSVPADDALVAASRTARLVVVGCEDVSTVGALLVGSTTSAVIERASCPVVAWRGEYAHATDGPIVVGVGDPATAGAALKVGFSLADALAAPLRVIHGWPAWQMPDDMALPDLIERTVSPSRNTDERESAHWRQLNDVVDPWRLQYPGVNVTLLGMTAAPSKALLEHIGDAQMVVVGSGHRNALLGCVFGSTSRKLLHHARLPVVVCSASASTGPA